MTTINGDGGDNALVGGTGDDIINGLGGDDSIYGAGGADSLSGGSGDDFLNAVFPDGFADTLLGGSGDDITYACQTDIVDGGAGHDIINLKLDTTTKALKLNLDGLTSGGTLHLADGTSVTGMEAGAIYFGTGNDSIKLGDALVSAFGGMGDDTLTGGKGSDVLGPGVGDDLVNGGKGLDWVVYTEVTQAVHVDLSLAGAQNTIGAGMDTLVSIENVAGSALDDTLIGSKLVNLIQGSSGADTMTGGAGADHFVYTSYYDSLASSPDHITDLSKADVIDLSGVDADTSTPYVDDAFTMVASFTGHAGEATFVYDGQNTILSLDVTGDGVADSVIVIEGDHHTFSNFVL